MGHNPISHALREYAVAQAESARSAHLVLKLGPNAANAPNTGANQIHFGARAITWNKNLFRPEVGKVLDEFTTDRWQLARTERGAWATSLYDSLGLSKREDRGEGLTHLDQRSLLEFVHHMFNAVRSYLRDPDGLERADMAIATRALHVLVRGNMETLLYRLLLTEYPYLGCLAGGTRQATDCKTAPGSLHLGYRS